jgi:hypothetical protein
MNLKSGLFNAGESESLWQRSRAKAAMKPGQRRISENAVSAASWRKARACWYVRRE